jgi:hypothetical protein
MRLKEITAEHLKKYNEDIEERFIEQSIDHCQGMIDYITDVEKKGKLSSEIAKILQAIYILDYAKKYVGSSRAQNFFNFEIFREFTPEKHYENWDYNQDLKTKIEEVTDNQIEFNYEEIKAIWKELFLDINQPDKIIKKINADMIYQYKLIGSEIDRDRRNLVRKIADYEKNNQGTVPEIRPGALIFAFTKKCRNFCRHCMIRKSNIEPFVLTHEKIKEALDTACEYGIMACDCSGGEPLLEPQDVFYTFENCNMSQTFVTNSANVAANREKLEEIVKGIWDSYQKNKENRQIAIQISIDKFHAEILRKKDDTLRENSPLMRTVDQIEIIFKKYPEINVNFFTLRSKNEYVLKYLFRELERRDIQIVDEGEAFWLWHELTGKVPEKGMDILQILLKFKYNDQIKEVHCGVQSISELVYANALCPWEYLGSSYSFDDFKEMKEADKLWMESDMLFLEADGNIFLGGHLEGAWSLGTLAEESMARIIDSFRCDPLIYYINKNFGKIVVWAEELEPAIRNELHLNPTGMSIMHRIFGDAAMRLYLTKRIILEETESIYPKELVEILNIKENIDDIKNEYSAKKLPRNRYY